MSKSVPTPVLKTLDGVLQKILNEGMILQDPGQSRHCELVLPYEMDVQFECPKAIWLGITAAIHMDAKVADNLRKVHLKEPGCGGTWSIVASTNLEALKWECPEESPIQDDEEDEPLESKPAPVAKNLH